MIVRFKYRNEIKKNQHWRDKKDKTCRICDTRIENVRVLKVYEKIKVGNYSREIFKSIYLLIIGARKVGGSKEKRKEEIREKKAKYQKEIVKERRTLP